MEPNQAAAEALKQTKTTNVVATSSNSVPINTINQTQPPSQPKREREETSDNSVDSQDTNNPKRQKNDKIPPLSSSSTSADETFSSSTTSKTPSPYFLVLSQVHPNHSLTANAALVLEHFTHGIVYLIKSSVVEKEASTLQIVQTSLSIALKECGELLKYCGEHYLEDATKARAKATSTVSAFNSVVSCIFHATGHSLTEPALLFVCTVVDFMAAEILEMAGNCASDCYRKEIHPGDIKLAVENDLEFDILFKKLNLNQFQLWNGCLHASLIGCVFFQLVSGVDGGVTHIPLSELLVYWRSQDESGYYEYRSENTSLTLLSHMSGSSDLKVIIPNVTSSGIKALYSWHFERLLISSDKEEGKKKILHRKTDENLSEWRQLNAADPTLYANVLMAADFLGCDELCNSLLHSFDDTTDPIETIRSCYEIIPNFAEMLFFHLGFSNVAACETFLTKLTTNTEELTYLELQICDGMYLCKGALYNVSQPVEIQPNPTLSLSRDNPIHSDLLENMEKNRADEYSELKHGKWFVAKTWKICTHLNLKKWTEKERLRRKEMADVEKQGNTLIRFSEGEVDDLLYYSSAPSVVSAAKTAAKSKEQEKHYQEWLSQQTNASEVRAALKALGRSAAAPTTEAPTPAPEQKQLHFKQLDQKMWDTVAGDDLVAAQELYKQGACANLWCGDGDGIIPYDLYISSGIFNGNILGLTTLMQASQNNSIAMMTWLIDVGCDVNAPVPRHDSCDGYPFGGATALVYATTRDAVNLLLSCGAKTTTKTTDKYGEFGDWGESIWYNTCNCSGNAIPFTILASHLYLRRGSDRDLIARALIRHGADVNEASYPYDWDNQGCFFMTGINKSPVSYWPSVVVSGDVLWAKQLIENYNANINWPNGYSHTWSKEIFKGKVTGLGATVSDIHLSVLIYTYILLY